MEGKSPASITCGEEGGEDFAWPTKQMEVPFTEMGNIKK